MNTRIIRTVLTVIAMTLFVASSTHAQPPTPAITIGWPPPTGITIRYYREDRIAIVSWVHQSNRPIGTITRLSLDHRAGVSASWVFWHDGSEYTLIDRAAIGDCYILTETSLMGPEHTPDNSVVVEASDAMVLGCITPNVVQPGRSGAVTLGLQPGQAVTQTFLPLLAMSQP